MSICATTDSSTSLASPSTACPPAPASTQTPRLSSTRFPSSSRSRSPDLLQRWFLTFLGPTAYVDPGLSCPVSSSLTHVLVGIAVSKHYLEDSVNDTWPARPFVVGVPSSGQPGPWRGRQQTDTGEGGRRRRQGGRSEREEREGGADGVSRPLHAHGT